MDSVSGLMRLLSFGPAANLCRIAASRRALHLEPKMLKKNIALVGTSVTLRGVNQSDFEKIVQWRNDPEINRYLNQPYKLTVELQTQWYNQKYLPSNDLLFVFVENRGGTRIGTVGLNDYDPIKRIGIGGRLLIGDKKYRGSFELLEGIVLFYDFVFGVLQLSKVYTHVVRDNRKAAALNNRIGFVPNTGDIVFPECCQVHGMELVELVNTREGYEKKKIALRPMIEHFLKQY